MKKMSEMSERELQESLKAIREKKEFDAIPKFDNPEIWIQLAVRKSRRSFSRVNLRMNTDGSFSKSRSGIILNPKVNEFFEEIAIRILDGEKKFVSEDWGFWRKNDSEINDMKFSMELEKAVKKSVAIMGGF